MSLPSGSRTGGGLFSLVGGLLFAASLLYAAFVYLTAFGRPAPAWSWPLAAEAATIDALLFTLFAVHHSVFARLGVKAWVARRAAALERSIYVWCASLLFGLVMWAWMPVPGVAWTVSGGAALLMLTVQGAGVVVTGLASRRLGVLALAGVRTSAPGDTHRAPSPPSLQRDGFYGLVRHPIYFAWVLMVWPAPVMTGSRLLFAALTTAYLAAAVPLEERSLRREFGDAYDDYRRQVRWRMVPGIY